MEQTYWIVIDNRPTGPYSFETLRQMGITPSTMVWTEGMPDWAPAHTLPELAPLIGVSTATEEQPCTQGFSMPDEPNQPHADQQPVAAYQADFRPQTTDTAAHAVAVEPCPPNYLGWAIAATVLCCTILGIVAIILSSQVKLSYARGQYEKARKQSEWTQWMIILAITLGIISWPFQLAMSSLF